MSFPKLVLDGDDAMTYCSALARDHAVVLVPPEAMAPLDGSRKLGERIGPRFSIDFGRTTLPGLLQQRDAPVVTEQAVASSVEVDAAAQL